MFSISVWSSEFHKTLTAAQWCCLKAREFGGSVQLSGGVLRLGVGWDCAGQWIYLKAREVGGNV